MRPAWAEQNTFSRKKEVIIIHGTTLTRMGEKRKTVDIAYGQVQAPPMMQHRPNLVLPPLHSIIRSKIEDKPPAPQTHILLKTAVVMRRNTGILKWTRTFCSLD
jgi:hypothetical protein